MIPSRIRFLVPFVAAQSGCGSPLGGTWSGTADCGEDGAFPVELPLQRDGGAAVGVGTVDGLTYFSQPATYSFAASAVVEEDDAVDLSLSDCQFEAQDQAWSSECGDAGLLRWDGADQMSGTLPIAVLDCALTLARD